MAVATAYMVIGTEQFECGICTELPAVDTPVHGCCNGHWLCAACYARLDTRLCPYCRDPLAVRCLYIESILRDASVRCAQTHCRRVVRFGRYAEHAAHACVDRALACKYASCDGWTAASWNAYGYVRHLTRVHGVRQYTVEAARRACTIHTRIVGDGARALHAEYERTMSVHAVDFDWLLESHLPAATAAAGSGDARAYCLRLSALQHGALRIVRSVQLEVGARGAPPVARVRAAPVHVNAPFATSCWRVPLRTLLALRGTGGTGGRRANRMYVTLRFDVDEAAARAERETHAFGRAMRLRLTHCMRMATTLQIAYPWLRAVMPSDASTTRRRPTQPPPPPPTAEDMRRILNHRWHSRAQAHGARTHACQSVCLFV
jgi:hypothetical protein